MPFEEPVACYPEETGANSWIPVNPATGVAALLENEILTKLKTAKFVSYTNVQVNLRNQARIIFQVILNSAISRQSQAAVKNSPEWAALSVDLNEWALLLSVIVRLHTVHRGADVEESRIVARMKFESKLRSFKQSAGVDSGAHLERFDDLILEGKTIGANTDQRELAYLLVNSMRSNAARNKRTLLMEIGQPTPSSYIIAKAFVLESEAMARSVSEFNGGYSNGGHAAITEIASDMTDKESGESDELLNFATSDGKSQKRLYTPLQKKHWKELPEAEKKKVQALEEIADKIRSGQKMDFDVRTISSSLTSSTTPSNREFNYCWKCKEPRDGPKGHEMRNCPMKDKIKGAPHAPPSNRGRFRREDDKRPEPKKKVEVAAIGESVSGDDDSEDEYYHLDILVTDHDHEQGGHRQETAIEAGLFLDDSESDEDEQGNVCMITEEECNEEVTKRLEKEIKGLSEATRIPNDEEITFQTDLANFPHLCKGVLANKRWDTAKVNGVTVVKGGPFDTTGARKATLFWNLPASGERELAEVDATKTDVIPKRTEGNENVRSLQGSKDKTTDHSENEKYGTPPPPKVKDSTLSLLPRCLGCEKLEVE